MKNKFQQLVKPRLKKGSLVTFINIFSDKDKWVELPFSTYYPEIGM